MKPLMLILYVFFFLNTEKIQMYISKKLTEKNLKTWNEKTIRSIKDQLIKTNNSQIKATLKNRLDVLRSSLYSATANEKGEFYKGKSLRYKLLEEIYANRQMSKNIFIVESESEGEVLQLRNYLIMNNVSTSHVIGYSYFKNGWTKVRDTVISKIDLHSKLQYQNNEINSLTGNNLSDVILSEFNSLDILSHYYIPLSIEKNDIIWEILKL